MPTYGYRCKSCGHEFEILQRMSDPPLKTCPKCSGELGKMMYAAGVIFKGSGYYRTDYKSAATKSAEKADSNGAGTPSDSSGETKPAAEAKAESKSPKSDSTT
jgi:putative FmdB family regulatory protein